MGLKDIRKRIGSVKSTQKITKAMKMVAGARLNRAQLRIQAMRPYAIQTQSVLAAVVRTAGEEELAGAVTDEGHPLLARRAEGTALVLVVTSDRGLCGAFNASINRTAERFWKELEAEGKQVKLVLVGRKGRDYFRRRGAPIHQVLEGVWDKLGVETARSVAAQLLAPFVAGDVDSIYIVYNEFKSAMTQKPVVEKLFPLDARAIEGDAGHGASEEFIFEPDEGKLLERLVPMYVEITVLRSLYESMASELGARMTAMDSATKNASEMIGALTLKYNRERQAAITKELMEIIGGAEALSG